MKQLLLLLLLFTCVSVEAQTRFKLVEKEIDSMRSVYSLVDESNGTIRVLDSTKYYTALDGFEYGYFAIVGIKNTPGWYAIDANEKILFRVYNTSFGEPSPDQLTENKIRIIDDNEKIGFANEKGAVVIRPQFEIASSFQNGYAIIGEICKKIPWENPLYEDSFRYHSIACVRHGYIDEKGNIVRLGDYTIEQIMGEIKWERTE